MPLAAAFHRGRQQRLRLPDGLCKRRLLRRTRGEAAPEGVLALLAQIAKPVVGLFVDLLEPKIVVRLFRPLVVAGPDRDA